MLLYQQKQRIALQQLHCSWKKGRVFIFKQQSTIYINYTGQSFNQLLILIMRDDNLNDCLFMLIIH